MKLPLIERIGNWLFYAKVNRRRLKHLLLHPDDAAEFRRNELEIRLTWNCHLPVKYIGENVTYMKGRL